MPVSLVEYLLCENGLQHHAPAFAGVTEDSFRSLLMQVRAPRRVSALVNSCMPCTLAPVTWPAGCVTPRPLARSLTPRCRGARQDYGKYGVVAMQDKQKLFRLIRKLSTAEPCASPPRKSMPTTAVLQAVCASSLEASRARAQALDGDAALLDLEDADVDFFSQARAPILNCSFACGAGNLSRCGALNNQTKQSTYAVHVTVSDTLLLRMSRICVFAQCDSVCVQDAAPSGYSHHHAGEGRPHAQSWSGTEAPAYAQASFQSAAAQFVERSDPPKIRVVVRKRPLNQKVRHP